MSNGLQELETTIRKQRASYAGKFRGFVIDHTRDRLLGCRVSLAEHLGGLVSSRHR